MYCPRCNSEVFESLLGDSLCTECVTQKDAVQIASGENLLLPPVKGVEERGAYFW